MVRTLPSSGFVSRFTPNQILRHLRVLTFTFAPCRYSVGRLITRTMLDTNTFNNSTPENLTGGYIHNNCKRFNISKSGCDSDTHRHIPKYCLLTLYFLVSVVSIVGNTVVVFVIYKFRRMQSFMNWVIFNLAVADLLTTLFCICVDVTMEIKERWVFGEVLCPVLFPLRGTMIFSSVFTLVFLSLSRYWAIIYPLKPQPTVRFAKMCIVVIWLASLIITIPYMTSLKYDKEKDICYEMWSKEQHKLYTVYTFIFMYVLPVLLIGISYYRIVDQIVNIKSRKRLLSMCATIINDRVLMKENRDLVKLAIIITSTFCLCILPYHIMWLLYDFSDIEEDFIYFQDAMHIVYLLLYLNSAINPISYNIFSSNFRAAFRELLVSCHRKDTSLLNQNKK